MQNRRSLQGEVIPLSAMDGERRVPQQSPQGEMVLALSEMDGRHQAPQADAQPEVVSLSVMDGR